MFKFTGKVWKNRDKRKEVEGADGKSKKNNCESKKNNIDKRNEEKGRRNARIKE